MLQPATLQFLRDLKENNEKPWFDEHRKQYENAKNDFEQFISKVLEGMTELHPAFAGQKAKDAIYRIFRDVRFSKDKTPYKSHFGGYFTRAGKKWNGAGYYLHLEPGAMFIGGGLWQPEGPLLKVVRQEIDYSFEEFKSIIENKNFRKYFPVIKGDSLQKLPQGYAEDNPAIEYLKHKSFIISYNADDAVFTGKDAVKKVITAFTVMKPFVDFLNRSLD